MQATSAPSNRELLVAHWTVTLSLRKRPLRTSLDSTQRHQQYFLPATRLAAVEGLIALHGSIEDQNFLPGIRSKRRGTPGYPRRSAFWRTQSIGSSDPETHPARALPPKATIGSPNLYPTTEARPVSQGTRVIHPAEAARRGLKVRVKGFEAKVVAARCCSTKVDSGCRTR